MDNRRSNARTAGRRAGLSFPERRRAGQRDRDRVRYERPIRARSEADDFLVYEDNQPVEVTHFSAERVPVSLGIAIDTSGSMAGEKIQEAQNALDRFVFELLDKQDEFFIYRFSNYPTLLQGWTAIGSC
jgi:Mg-chelatase subunit ChlD